MNKQLIGVTVLSVTMCFFIIIGSGVARGQALYDPPICADDLDAGQRLGINKAKHSAAGNSQEWGYDLLGYRHASGRDWSRLLKDRKGPANNDYVIYNKPVYAMAAGTVIACWRNAEENESAGATHKNRSDKRIAVGGNFLWVEEDDGERVFYADAIPGTIPARLCPHNAALLASPDGNLQMPVESHVPVVDRARVAAGEFLMRVGNSCKSSEPHLHIHKVDSAGAARQLNFRRCLFSPLTNSSSDPRGSADLNDWRSYARNPLPQGPALIWSPRRLEAEYVRHGLKFSGFQRPVVMRRSSSRTE